MKLRNRLPSLLKNKESRNKVYAFYQRHQEKIVDIVLFGSTVRGKEKPSDIDILIIYKEREDLTLNHELKKILGTGFQITSRTYKNLFDRAFLARESFIFEGYSLLYDTLLSEGLGLRAYILFKYVITEFPKSKSMRFYYALYGRSNDTEGVLQKYHSIKFSDTILLTPLEYSEPMKDFLAHWEIPFMQLPILFPMRMEAVIQKYPAERNTVKFGVLHGKKLTPFKRQKDIAGRGW